MGRRLDIWIEYVGWKRRGNEQELRREIEREKRKSAMYEVIQKAGYMPWANKTILHLNPKMQDASQICIKETHTGELGKQRSRKVTEGESKPCQACV
jgi:hypothetical protein